MTTRTALNTSAETSDREIIVGVAILFPDGGYAMLLKPYRHRDVIRSCHARGMSLAEIADGTQGFWTSHERFVDRADAVAVAEAAHQRRRVTGPRRELFSEDLW